MLHEVTTAIFFNAFWDIVLSCARSGFIRKKEKEKKTYFIEGCSEDSCRSDLSPQLITNTKFY